MAKEVNFLMDMVKTGASAVKLVADAVKITSDFASDKTTHKTADTQETHHYGGELLTMKGWI